MPTIIERFLPEFDREMDKTESILAVVPDELLAWKAAPSLNTVGWVASHLADTLSWVEVTIKETSFDVAPVDGAPHETPILDSAAAIVQLFQDNRGSARDLLAAVTDEQLAEPWTLMQGGVELFTVPRGDLMKDLFLNHIIHHRAFLIAYLRINAVECPAMYG